MAAKGKIFFGGGADAGIDGVGVIPRAGAGAGADAGVGLGAVGAAAAAFKEANACGDMEIFDAGATGTAAGASCALVLVTVGCAR